MATTWADVVLMAPELAAISDTDRQDAILADAYAQLNSNLWSSVLDLAAKYMAAHLATLYQRRGRSGQVTSESVGQVSRSYGQQQGANSYELTPYGQLLEALGKTIPAARWLVV